MDNEKRAFMAGASGIYKSFEEWKSQQVEETVSPEQIKLVNDTWNEQGVFSTTSQLPKKTSPKTRSIAKAIEKYGIDKCLESIRNYAEILDSPFFFKYEWDIKTFFERKNGAPEFMEDGSKYLSYVRWKGNNKLKYSQLNINKQKQIRQIATNLSERIIRLKSSSNNINMEAAMGQMYPLIFCGVLTEQHVMLDMSVTNPFAPNSFQVRFSDIVITGSNNSTHLVPKFMSRYESLTYELKKNGSNSSRF